MNAQHRRSSTSSPADFVADHAGGVLTAAVAIIAAVTILATFLATAGAPTTAGGTTTPLAAATVTAPIDRLHTPQAHAYFAALYTDATIGPEDLSSDNALKLGEHVCDGLRGGDTLARSYAYVRDVTRLDKMQAARLVDAADRNLCHK